MRGRSIAEVLVVFVVFRCLFAWSFSSTDFAMIERAVLGWSYLVGFVMILLPVSILALTRRNFESYGLTMKEWRYNLDVGLTGTFIRACGSPLVLLFLSMVHISYLGATGALLLAGSTVAAILLLLLVLRWQERRRQAVLSEPSVRANLAILVILLFLPLLLGLYLNRLTLGVVSTVVWQFLFSGFGEEIMFRGIINRE